MAANKQETGRVTLDGPTWLVIETSLDSIEPTAALRWFTEPELLAQWWGDEHEIEPVPGGRYEVRWPALKRTLQGEVLLSAPDQLIFSWSWEEEPELAARMVVVRGETDGNGTRLTIAHGPYQQATASLPDEDTDRESHREGWLFFLPKLHVAVAESVKRPENEKFWEDAHKGYERLRADPVEWKAYTDELKEWDTLSSDGLENEEPYSTEEELI